MQRPLGWWGRRWLPVCPQSPGWRKSNQAKEDCFSGGRGRAASAAGAACCPERTRPKGEPQVPGGRQAPGLLAPPQEADPSACQPPQEPQTGDSLQSCGTTGGAVPAASNGLPPGAVPEATFLGSHGKDPPHVQNKAPLAKEPSGRALALWKSAGPLNRVFCFSVMRFFRKHDFPKGLGG